MALEDALAVRAVADALSTAAGTYHEMWKAGIQDGSIAAADAMLHVGKEQALRQNAAQMYVQAAALAGQDVGDTQAGLEGAIRDANQAIAKMKQAAAAIELVGDLVTLAAAITARKPKLALAAVKELRSDLKQVRQA